MRIACLNPRARAPPAAGKLRCTNLGGRAVSDGLEVQGLLTLRSCDMKRWASILGAATLMLGVAGCADNTGNGALIGGAAGAGIGAIIGNNSHGRTAEGALIGG